MVPDSIRARVQEVCNHPGEAIDIGIDSYEKMMLLLPQLPVRLFQHQFSKPFDRSQRRPQFMGDMRKKLGLEAIHLLQFFIGFVQLFIGFFQLPGPLRTLFSRSKFNSSICW